MALAPPLLRNLLSLPVITVNSLWGRIGGDLLHTLIILFDLVIDLMYEISGSHGFIFFFFKFLSVKKPGGGHGGNSRANQSGMSSEVAGQIQGSSQGMVLWNL